MKNPQFTANNNNNNNKINQNQSRQRQQIQQTEKAHISPESIYTQISPFKIYLRIKPILSILSNPSSNNLAQKQQLQQKQKIAHIHLHLHQIDSKKIKITSPYYTYEQPQVYEYQKVFNQVSTNQQIFNDAVKMPIKHVLEGFNSTVFIYGMTAAGKTYTMFGKRPSNSQLMTNRTNRTDRTNQIVQINRSVSNINVIKDNNLISKHNNKLPQATYQQQGILQYSTDYLLKELKFKDSIKTEVFFSFFEIYNENIRDLLQQNSCNLAIKEQVNKNNGNTISVCDLREVLIQTVDQIKELIQQGFKRRSMNSTKNNEVSSRSHAIMQFSIKRYVQNNSTLKTISNKSQVKVIESKLSLVDLAGNQKTFHHSLQNQSKKFIEGVNINKSLLTLGKCFQMLSEQKCSSSSSSQSQSFVPYRDSKLTRILKQSLGGNSKTVMIACVSSESRFYQETLNTLKYSCIAKKIKNKNVKTNIRNLSISMQNLKSPKNFHNHPSININTNTNKCINQSHQQNHNKVFLNQSKKPRLTIKNLNRQNSHHNINIISQMKSQSQQLLKSKLQPQPQSQSQLQRQLRHKQKVNQFFQKLFETTKYVAELEASQKQLLQTIEQNSLLQFINQEQIKSFSQKLKLTLRKVWQKKQKAQQKLRQTMRRIHNQISQFSIIQFLSANNLALFKQEQHSRQKNKDRDRNMNKNMNKNILINQSHDDIVYQKHDLHHSYQHNQNYGQKQRQLQKKQIERLQLIISSQRKQIDKLKDSFVSLVAVTPWGQIQMNHKQQKVDQRQKLLNVHYGQNTNTNTSIKQHKIQQNQQQKQNENPNFCNSSLNISKNLQKQKNLILQTNNNLTVNSPINLLSVVTPIIMQDSRKNDNDAAHTGLNINDNHFNSTTHKIKSTANAFFDIFSKRKSISRTSRISNGNMKKSSIGNLTENQPKSNQFSKKQANDQDQLIIRQRAKFIKNLKLLQKQVKKQNKVEIEQLLREYELHKYSLSNIQMSMLKKLKFLSKAPSSSIENSKQAKITILEHHGLTLNLHSYQLPSQSLHNNNRASLKTNKISQLCPHNKLNISSKPHSNTKSLQKLTPSNGTSASTSTNVGNLLKSLKRI